MKGDATLSPQVVALEARIREQARIIRELSESQTRLRAILDNEPECVKLLAADGTLLEMNPAGLRMLEADSFEQVRNHCVYPLIVEQHREPFRALSDKVMAGGSGSVEFELVGLKGSRRWLETHASPLRDEAGAVTAMLGITRDITERKRDETTFRENQAQLAQQLSELEQLYHTAPVGLALLDRDLRFVRINERLAAINGLPAPEHVGRTLEEVLPALSGELRGLHRRVLDTGEPVLDVEIRGRTPADPGSESYWVASYLPVHGKDGQVVGVSAVVADVTEQKRARMRLDEAQRIGRIGDWEYDVDTSHVFWSPQVYALYGRDPALGPPVYAEALAYYDADSRTLAQDHLARLMASGQEQQYELRVELPGGAVAHHAVVAVPVLDEAGQVLRVRGTVQDISQRKQAEVLLQHSERQLRMVMDGLGPHMFVGLMDTHGVVLMANRPALEVASLSEDAVLGQPVEDTYWFAYSDAVRQRLRDAVRRAALGEEVRYDERIRVAEDQFIWLDFSLHPLRDETGVIVSLVPSAIAIDERKQAEEALQARETLLALIYENVDDVVFVLDVLPAGYRFAAVNPRFLEATGLTSEQVSGKFIEDVVPEPSLSLVLQKYADAVAGGRPVRWEEVTPYPAGTKYGDVTVAPIFDGEGRCRQLIGTVHDMTERKHAEQQLREAALRQQSLARSLVQAQEAEQRRISEELHDRIGQDLTALGINLNIIGSPVADPLASAARLKDSRMLLESTIAAVRGLITELRPPVLQDYGLLAGLRWYGNTVGNRSRMQVSVHGVEPAPRLDPVVEGALFRIAQEALTNIIKHAQAQRVDLVLESRAGGLALSIIDDGTGFDLGALERTGPRAHWGLEMMRERAETIGARFRVQSTPGHGTRVVIYLEHPP